MKRSVHEGTTAQLGAAYPFVASPSLGTDLVLIGRELSGSLFSYDPFELYRKGLVTSPNLVVLGQVGRGKSSFVKSYCYRQFAHGRRIFVIDPKGEYADLANATGGSFVRLSGERTTGFNPLVTSGSREDEQLVHRVLESISAASLGRELSPDEVIALRHALSSLRRARSIATLRAVANQLFSPEVDEPPFPGCQVSELSAIGRAPAFSLLRLLGGEFGAMFDRPTGGLDLSAETTVIDVSAYYRSDALSVLMVALLGSLLSAVASSSCPAILVIDEAWALLDNPFARAFLQSSFKLARAYGLSNVLVAHRPSDLRSVGGTATASGLVADAETAVLFGMSPPEAEQAAELFSLGQRQRALLGSLGRGVALWSVGGTVTVVRHLLSAAEQALVDTDAAMRLGWGPPRAAG